MRLQRSNVIGLCMPYATYSNFAALVDSIEQCVSDNNYQLMQVLSRQDPAKEFARVERLVAYKIGGLMLVPSLKPKAILDFLASARTCRPFIVNRTVAEDRRFDQVSVDHRAVMLQPHPRVDGAALRQRDPRREYPGLSVTRERIKGMIEGAGGARATSVLECGEDHTAFLPKLGAALRQSPKPAALVASNSGIASWAIQDRPSSASAIRNTCRW